MRTSGANSSKYNIFSFFDWWRAELAALMPVRLRQLLSGTPSFETLHLDHDINAVDTAAALSEALHRALETRRTSSGRHRRVAWQLTLSSQVALVRYHRFKTAARSKLHALLQTELDHALPFKREDVCWAFEIEQEERDLIVRQVILKRSLVDALRRTAEAAGIPVRAVGVWSDRPSENSLLTLAVFDEPLSRGAKRLHQLNRGLALMLVATFMFALVPPYIERKRELEELAGIADALRRKAVNETRRINEAKALHEKATLLLRRKESAVSLLTTLDVLTRLLPDRAWLSELQLARSGEVAISGFIDRGAASLLQTMAADPMLPDVRFSAPVTIDGAEKRERFRISIRPLMKESG